MKRTTIVLEDWVRELVKELDMPIKELVHRSILAVLDNLPETPLAPDKAFLRLGYVPVKLPEQIRELGISREEKAYFGSWLLEVALKQFEKSGVSVERLYELFKQVKGRSGDGSTDRQVQGNSDA